MQFRTPALGPHGLRYSVYYTKPCAGKIPAPGGKAAAGKMPAPGPDGFQYVLYENRCWQNLTPCGKAGADRNPPPDPDGLQYVPHETRCWQKPSSTQQNKACIRLISFVNVQAKVSSTKFLFPSLCLFLLSGT